MEQKWIIRNLHNPDLYWDNEFGWVEHDQAEVFSEWESGVFNLPDEGEWVHVNEWLANPDDFEINNI